MKAEVIITKLIMILYNSKMDNGDQTQYFTTELEKIISEYEKDLESLEVIESGRATH
jgi:hypothetical protein